MCFLPQIYPELGNRTCVRLTETHIYRVRDQLNVLAAMKKVDVICGWSLVSRETLSVIRNANLYESIRSNVVIVGNNLMNSITGLRLSFLTNDFTHCGIEVMGKDYESCGSYFSNKVKLGSQHRKLGPTERILFVVTLAMAM